MLLEDRSDVTPNDKLREKIEDWRYGHAQAAGSQEAYDVAETFEQYADELEELLNDR